MHDETYAGRIRPTIIALIGIIFCIWSLKGNDVNFCNTAGCTLYHDATIANLSLWWYGAATFCTILLLALVSPLQYAALFCEIALIADICLLSIMSLTAPCINCLLVGAIFALTYRSFYTNHAIHTIRKKKLILLVWGVFFFVNVVAVVKQQIGTWAILGESDSAKIHLFFSPSCTHCRDAITFYAGSIQVAFYPVADTDEDLSKIAKIERLLKEGKTIDSAVKESQNEKAWTLAESFKPTNIALRLRVLENKAHIYLAGSSGVPFFEYQGIPSQIAKTIKQRRQKMAEPEQSDQLPLELLNETDGQCTNTKCD